MINQRKEGNVKEFLTHINVPPLYFPDFLLCTTLAGGRLYSKGDTAIASLGTLYRVATRISNSYETNVQGRVIYHEQRQRSMKRLVLRSWCTWSISWMSKRLGSC